MAKMSLSSRSNRLAQIWPPLVEIDQLRGHPDPVAGLAHAAFEHVADAERLGDLGHRDRRLLVNEGRIARDHMQIGQPRQIGDDVLADPVGEIFLLDVAAHIVEREHRDRGLLDRRRRRLRRRGGFGRRGGIRLGGGADLKRIDPHRLDDVFELGVTEIVDGQIKSRAHLPIGIFGKADRAGLGHALQPRGDVDAVAHQIVIGLLDHIAQMDADAKVYPALGRQTGVALKHAVLHLDRAAHSVDDAAELDEKSITHTFHHAAVVHRNSRVDQVTAERAKPRQRAILVRPRHAAETNDIRGQDRRQFSCLAHRVHFQLFRGKFALQHIGRKLPPTTPFSSANAAGSCSPRAIIGYSRFEKIDRHLVIEAFRCRPQRCQQGFYARPRGGPSGGPWQPFRVPGGPRLPDAALGRLAGLPRGSAGTATTHFRLKGTDAPHFQAIQNLGTKLAADERSRPDVVFDRFWTQKLTTGDDVKSASYSSA